MTTIIKGQKAVFNYDRNYMTTQRTRNHDGEIVTVTSDVWEDRGLSFVTVENQHNTIYPVMIQELTSLPAMYFQAWLQQNSHLKSIGDFYTNPFNDGTYKVTLKELETLFYRRYKNTCPVS